MSTLLRRKSALSRGREDVCGEELEDETAATSLGGCLERPLRRGGDPGLLLEREWLPGLEAVLRKDQCRFREALKRIDVSLALDKGEGRADQPADGVHAWKAPPRRRPNRGLHGRVAATPRG